MQNLIDPAILFFIFGVLAGTVKSNLEIPPAISRFLSLYLLMALGLKGGFALSQSGLTASVGISLASAVLLAIVIPLIGYAVLRRFVSGFDAAAVAAGGSAGAAGVGGTPVAQGPGPDPVRPNAEACGSSDFAVRFQSIM